ncbi:BppU family phage baseplate upper protein [Leuconostoc suionicum]|uniref:BppU family phage baseplate upper protein n=1 Tax=Leuconostoc suionicum TaxID=1511761 RepID=UPI0028CFFA4F|nr:BppU family phage baseplate upper protein [Leuconostoc suionicum]
MSNQYLSFDVTKQSAPQQLITGRQGDSQLKFVTMLFWDGDKNVPYDLTGKQVAFEALKPDNTHIVDYEGITILDAPAGLVRYSFNEQVFSVVGTMQQAFFKITHTDGDNNVIADSTLEVTINILENRVEFGINSKDYLSEYDDLIAQVKKKFDDYAATVQESIEKAAELHDQINQYVNLINENKVVTQDEFDEKLNDKLSSEFIATNKKVKGNGNDPFYMAVKSPFKNYYKNDIQTLASKLKSGNMNIGFITDNHYELGNYSPNAIQHYSHLLTLSRLSKSIDTVVFGGDNINGNVNKEILDNETSVLTNLAFDTSYKKTDVFLVLGNHDTGVGQMGDMLPSQTLTYDEIKNYYRTSESQYGEIRNGDSLYGYKDYSDKKIRLIFMNSFDNPEVLNADGTYKYNYLVTSGYRQEQLEWLGKQALSLPDNSWHVIVFTHAPVPGTFWDDSSLQYNSDSFSGILKAFVMGSSFSKTDTSNSDYPVNINVSYSQKGNLIGVVSGHIHADGMLFKDGINYIETTCSLCYSGDVSKGRVKETETEDAWDVFSIDTAQRHVDIFRFGAYGSDREYVY